MPSIRSAPIQPHTARLLPQHQSVCAPPSKKCTLPPSPGEVCESRGTSTPGNSEREQPGMGMHAPLSPLQAGAAPWTALCIHAGCCALWYTHGAASRRCRARAAQSANARVRPVPLSPPHYPPLHDTGLEPRNMCPEISAPRAFRFAHLYAQMQPMQPKLCVPPLEAVPAPRGLRAGRGRGRQVRGTATALQQACA